MSPADVISPPRRAALLKLTLTGITLVLSLLTIEVAIRGRDAVRGLGFFSDHRNELTQMESIRPYRIFGPELYQERNGETYITSRWGEVFPLQKPPGSVRIVCFGGSTTENARAVEQYGLHYPLLLQRSLREKLGRSDVEVINVANSAYATPHSLIMLELDVLSWEPDIVILSHNINDLLAAYFPDFRSDYSHKYSSAFYLPDYESRYTLANILLQHSQLYWILKDRATKLLDEPPPLRRAALGSEPPALAYETFRRNLISFATLARTNGIAVVLASQPLEPTEEFFCRHMCGKPYNDIVVYPLHEEFLAHHRYYNQILSEVSQDLGVAYLDNAAVMGGRSEYFADLVHYTRAGVETLAANFSRYLIDQGMVR